MDTSSAPLADYFWIAGVDSLSYNDPTPGFSNKTTSNGTTPPSPKIDATIDEGSEVSEGDEKPQAENKSTPRATARHSRNNSWQRLSKLSNDARNSVSTLDELDTNARSNRSSVTIKAVPNTNVCD